jgi:hypothetical protein
MAQELKAKSTPAIQRNSSNLAHHWRYFEGDSRTIRDNSRVIRDNWRYFETKHEKFSPPLQIPNLAHLTKTPFFFASKINFFAESIFALAKLLKQCKLIAHKDFDE